MKKAYEQTLWIIQQLPEYESGLAPRAAKLLALIITGYSVGQWVTPWAAGRLFDVYHNYYLAWGIMTAAAVLGAGAIYMVTVPSGKTSLRGRVCQAGMP
jgi:hypothetical protein